MGLSKAEVEEEIVAVKGVLKIHEEAVKQNLLGIKANGLILHLLERELKKKKYHKENI